MHSTEAKVLIVDDDPDLRKALTLFLKTEGYGSETACDGVQAMKALERKMPDVILLDMKMPVMDGWEFGRVAREKYGSRLPPVIVMTAVENPAARAVEIGAQGWLDKPFDIDHLRNEVRRQLQTRAPVMKDT